jgi:hypothetical protein
VSIVVLAMVMLTAAPPSVLIVPSAPAARPTCEALVEVFASQNVRVKLAGEKAEAIACVKKATGRTECLVDSLKRAKVDGIVLVTATPRGAQLTLAMQLLSRTGESERQEKVSGLKAKLLAWARPAVERTVATLQAVIVEEPQPVPVVEKPQPTQPVVVSDAPVEPKLTPREPPHPELVATPNAPARPSKAGAWVVTGVAIAAGGTAAAFGGLGLSAKGRLDHLDNGVSPLTYSQAVALQGQTNQDMTIALGAGIGAAVAAVIAGVLWAN